MKNSKLSIIFVALLSFLVVNSSAIAQKSSMKNMVARMEVKEPIEGVCDNANVFVILPLSGNKQVKAKAPKTNEQIN